MAVTSQVMSFLGQNFGSVAGFAALTSLIPLIIFYLIKPEPEERVMPSMTFFMEREEEGKVSHAFSYLMRNLLLLLHILFVCAAAAAIAGPLVPGISQPDSSVIIVDRSASVSDEFEEVKDFAKSNLGERNTVIAIGDSSTVVAEEVHPSRARAAIESIETTDTETDLTAAIRTARDYDGQMVMASDLAQTSTSSNLKSIIDGLDPKRNVEVYEAEENNRWGIVDVTVAAGNATVEVRNFQEKDDTLQVAKGQETRTLEIPAGKIRTADFRVDPGENRIELESDPIESDNTAYITVPSDRNFDVLYLGASENRFVAQAVEIIPFTSYSFRRSPYEGDLDADIYFIGGSDSILQSNIREVEEQVKNDGKSMVIMQRGSLDNFDSAPASLGSARNVSAEVLEPVRTGFRTSVYEARSVNGDSLSSPREAVIQKDYGEGEVVLYNVNDADFRYEFMYPVFWKKLFEDLVERPSATDLNRQTGDTLEGERIVLPDGGSASGSVEMNQAGFYNSSGQIYSANLESIEESSENGIEYNSTITGPDSKSRGNARHISALLLALLATAELGYLVWTGEV